MPGLLRAFNRLIDAVLVASLAAIAAFLTMQVVLRYVFNAALPWPEELSQFLLVLVSFLGMYRAIGKDLHIRIDWLPKTRRPLLLGLRIVGLLSVCVLLGYVGIGGWRLAMTAWSQPSTALRLPMAVPYLIVPIACALSLVAVAASIVALLRRPDRSVTRR
ncbi:MAG: TRAP transporter small permease [Rhodospirillaceae bacterium]|nr:TRAP transporter small permease [Rhodospirillaceae bacterium]